MTPEQFCETLADRIDAVIAEVGLEPLGAADGHSGPYHLSRAIRAFLASDNVTLAVVLAAVTDADIRGKLDDEDRVESLITTLY